MKFFNSKKGFTLIELIVSIGVLSALAALALAIINPFAQFQKANDAKRKSDLGQIQRAIEQYYQDVGKYPSSSGNPNYTILDVNGTPVPWGGSTALWQRYMNVLPKDPLPSRKYIYFARADGQAYWLYTALENTKDTDLCNNGNACTSLVSNGVSNTVCGTTCNFGLSSSNVSP